MCSYGTLWIIRWHPLMCCHSMMVLGLGFRGASFDMSILDDGMQLRVTLHQGTPSSSLCTKTHHHRHSAPGHTIIVTLYQSRPGTRSPALQAYAPQGCNPSTSPYSAGYPSPQARSEFDEVQARLVALKVEFSLAACEVRQKDTGEGSYCSTLLSLTLVPCIT